MTDENNQASLPIPGEFRVATAEDALPRLVLVVKSQRDMPFSTVALVSDEVDLATWTDVRVDPDETGLPEIVLVQTDMCASVLNTQLSEPVGRLAADLEPVVRILPEPETLPQQRVGLPLLSRSDARWTWKQEELRDLTRLASELAEELMETGVGGDEPLPRAIGSIRSDWSRVISILPGLQAEIGLLDGDSPPIVRWDDADPDASEVAQRVLDDVYGSGWSSSEKPVGDRGSTVGSELRALAVAEERLATTGRQIWALDSALACVRLLDALKSADAETHLHRLLERRLSSAFGVLAALPDDLQEVGGRDLLQRVRIEFSLLTEWAQSTTSGTSSAELAGKTIGRWEEWDELHASPLVEYSGTLGGDGERFGVASPAMVMLRIVDFGERAKIQVDGSGLAASLQLSHELSNILAAAWVPASHGESVELRAAAAEVATGYPDGPKAWLHAYDPETGIVEAVTVLEPSEKARNGRFELRGVLPMGGAHTRFLVHHERLEQITVGFVLGQFLTAICGAPNIVDDFVSFLSEEQSIGDLLPSLSAATRSAAASLSLPSGSSSTLGASLARAALDARWYVVQRGLQRLTIARHDLAQADATIARLLAGLVT